ncbi:MAG: acylneuraminate cytidylyltransferase family protein [Candidatus Omnitrophica bacterium]|nr:acylneuraminate cytidylyltransferase family protein [Candidatus Omnitrophota bacterium]
MIGKLKVVAVIPARGGSKGLPGKNIIDLCGRPLIAYTIEAALKSAYTDRVIVTTDNEEIAKVSEEHGAEVPFMRPKHLAQDSTHTPPVIEHAVNFIEKRGYGIDLIVTLQPTSPLRTKDHIDKAIEILKRSGCGSLMSVMETAYPPYWVVHVKKNRAFPLVNDGTDYFRKESQQLPKTYQPNGAIYVTKRETLFNEKAIISKDCGVLVMNRKISMDVDTIEDLEKIKSLISKR